MSTIRVAVVGYGNIGRYSVEAVKAAPDMTLAGVVRRSATVGQAPPELRDERVVSAIEALGRVDVAILCSPTRSIPEVANAILAKGISTVDSFDIHGQALWGLLTQLHATARAHRAAAIIAAGWDPGSDSVLRALLMAMAPRGITYTNFGPGMSMGHSVVARSKEGVKDALSMTIPLGTGVHRRMVYVELAPGASLEAVAHAIKRDDYFSRDETHVMAVESVDTLRDMGHGVLMERKGASGQTQNQLFEFRMRINNPALTAQILVSCARAVLHQPPGAYTMLDIPPIHYLAGEREALTQTLV